MKTCLHTDRLERLRDNLQHFDLSPDFGDGEAVTAIRMHLMARIREAENAHALSAGLARATSRSDLIASRPVCQAPLNVTACGASDHMAKTILEGFRGATC